jgi:spectinomycin phosphotransferase
MLTPPDLAPGAISTTLRDRYGLRARTATFLPLGADINSFVFRVDAEDGTPYFLKLRRGEFDEIAVDVPAALHEQGIRQVMAPLATLSQRWWTNAHGYTWLLYPFFEGENGYHTTLSDAQWIAFGRTFRAIHDATLPPELAARVPREDYSPRWCDAVRDFDRQVETRAWDDRYARQLAGFWRAKRSEIRAIVDRTEALGTLLRGRTDPYVLCHTDMHPANLLVGTNGDLALVDWDAPLYAPKERDLIFLGGGIGQMWREAREETLFYQGYGPAEIDLVAFSYYRYTRIVDDIASYGMEIFGEQSSEEDRENGLRRLTGQFLPDHVVDGAHQTFERLQDLPDLRH